MIASDSPRSPWSIRSTSVLLLALVGTIGGCTLGSTGSVATPIGNEAPISPATEGTAASTPALDATTFTSARYGYQLDYPGSWTASETPGTGGTHPDEPGVDTFRDRIGHIVSIVGEPAVALVGWTCAIGKHLQDEHELVVEKVDEVDVAGVPGRVSDYHMVIDPYVIHYLTVEMVRDGQGLTISMESTTGRDAEDRELLEQLLGTLTWTA